MTNTAALKALAEKAKPDIELPFSVEHADEHAYYMYHGGDMELHDRNDTIAPYLTALDPATVLDPLSRLETAERERDAVTEAAEEVVTAAAIAVPFLDAIETTRGLCKSLLDRIRTYEVVAGRVAHEKDQRR